MTPLVSVITPTWQRFDLLAGRCAPSVAAQAYPLVEHVIVSDGPDPALREHFAAGDHRVRFAELAAHDPVCDYGVRARLRGVELARGDYIAFLDDDNAYRPEHLATLMPALLDDPSVDFAYSRMVVHPGEYQVGSQPPVCGQIDSSLLLCRRRLLDLENWRWIGEYAVDWDLVARWLKAGASWAYIPDVTVDYYKG